MTTVTKEQLITYFKNHSGPVFCQPSSECLHYYPAMRDMLGIVMPFSDMITNKFEVDWSIDKEWERISNIYPCLSKFLINEINILKPGIDIPQIADERCGDYRWIPSKRGDLVVISDALLQASNEESYKKVYGSLEHCVGVVTDKCAGESEQLIVTFACKEWTKIINIPSKLLVRVPEMFRLKEQEVTVNNININKAKHAVGDVVRVLASYSEDEYIGLIGVVKRISWSSAVGATFGHNEYIVDFNTLPNRCLSLTEGEGKVDVCTEQRIKEVHLDGWDEKISDKPWLLQFRTINSRNKVWLPHSKQEGRVIANPSALRSVGTGVTLEVKVMRPETPEGFEPKVKISCRDIDYYWEHDSFKSELTLSTVCLGIEEDRRNPNEIETKAYLYVFDRSVDIGNKVKYRILLGSINKRKSLLKKLAVCLKDGTIEHPWQMYRYLKKNTLGHFYKVYTAEEYINTVGTFLHV